MKQFTFTALMSLMISSAAFSDYIDTNWRVTKFTGEAWFLDASQIVGEQQSFYKGFAKGAFYSCDYQGQSSTYTTYQLEDFFKNPEFELFLSVRNEMSDEASKVFVHRITCASKDDPSMRKVLYPFVTNNLRQRAWYLFEGGIFTLENEG